MIGGRAARARRREAFVPLRVDPGDLNVSGFPGSAILDIDAGVGDRPVTAPVVDRDLLEPRPDVEVRRVGEPLLLSHDTAVEPILRHPNDRRHDERKDGYE